MLANNQKRRGRCMFSDYKIGPEAMEFFMMGYQSQLEGRLEEAVYYYKKSLKIEDTAEGRTFLGWAYSFMGKTEAAIRECKKAIEIDPEFGNPYNDIGSYLIQQCKPDEALPWLEKAKQAKRYATPEYAYVNSGRAFELMGLWPLAMDEYRQALRLCRDYIPAKAGLERLRVRLN
jgi:Tfp pilus assembly protein PilF